MNFIFILLGIIFIVVGINMSIIPRLEKKKHKFWDSSDSELAKSLEKKIKKGFRLSILLSCCGLFIILFSTSFYIVPSGYTGVRTTFGLIDQEPCKSGFNWVFPVVQSISCVNNKQQDIQFTGEISGETSERVTVLMDNIQVTYQIIPSASAWIYTNVDNWVEELVDIDMTSTALKSASRALSVIDVTDRAKVQNNAKNILQDIVNSKYGEERIIIKNVIVRDMDFLPEYNEAIESKARAIQKQEQQDIENQTAIDKAIADGKAAKERAQAEAEAELIRAQAKSDANKIIINSVTDVTQRQDVISKWDGALPKYIGTGNSDVVGILDSFMTNSTLPVVD